MTKRNAIMGVALSALVLAAGGAAQAAQHSPYSPKRTAWGDPDLQGTWPLDAVSGTPLERPERLGNKAQMSDEEYAAAKKAATTASTLYDREEKANKISSGHWFERGVDPLRQTSLITEPANGRIPPLTAEGKRRSDAMRSSWSNPTFDSIADFNSLDRCITRGLPASMIPFPYNNGVRIWQAPGYVFIQLEIVHETRVIPIDGRPPLPGVLKGWLGRSRGHFEGSTLVIDTDHFNGETPMNIVGPTNERIPTSKSMHIVERLAPTGPNSIQYEARVEDPEVLTGPWKMSFPWTRNDGYRFFEYDCHEGNTVVPNYIRATSPRFARQREAAAAAQKAAKGGG
jgi:hypothetical protein